MRYSYYSSCTSTMDIGRQFVSENPCHSHTFVARKQSSGRGQFGRLWLSEEENLHMSVCLRSDLSAQKMVVLASVMMVRVLKQFCPMQIKWPNDLYVGDKKIAGTLIETHYPWHIVGVGVNVVHAPCERSTSLRHESGFVACKEGIIHSFASAIEAWCVQPKPESCLIDEWNQNALYINECVKVERPGGSFEGIFVGIHNCGAAMVHAKGEKILVKIGNLSQI
ncbi:MAG: biotin--[acetyl-CoA-carboxylase] ligase [Alphaproteobacteria bacterium]|nr:biotin--[acetyl-CoA-carboxylase] ligase [Alphaproteobacteria bacterium]